MIRRRRVEQQTMEPLPVTYDSMLLLVRLPRNRWRSDHMIHKVVPSTDPTSRRNRRIHPRSGTINIRSTFRLLCILFVLVYSSSAFSTTKNSLTVRSDYAASISVTSVSTTASSRLASVRLLGASNSDTDDNDDDLQKQVLQQQRQIDQLLAMMKAQQTQGQSS